MSAYDDDDDNETVYSATERNNLYFKLFSDVSDYLTQSQAWTTIRRSTKNDCFEFFPDRQIDNDGFEDFGIGGIVEYNSQHYPSNWKVPYREISVNALEKCLQFSWNEEDGYSRCLYVIVPNDWEKTKQFPEIAVYAVYKNVFRRKVVHSRQDALIRPKEAFLLLKRSYKENDAISKRATNVFNTFQNYYTVVKPEAFNSKSINATMDGGSWTQRLGGVPFNLPKWEKFIFDKEDYENDVWNESNVSKEESRKVDLMCLKYQRTRHPKLGMRRVVAYFANTRNEKTIVSPVLIQYIFDDEHINEEHFLRDLEEYSKNKSNKCIMDNDTLEEMIIRESSGRTKIGTYDHLQSLKVKVTKRKVYNVLRNKEKCPGVLKRASGPTSNLDVHKLFESVQKYEGYAVHLGRDKKNKPTGSLTFKENLALFLKCAPSAKELKTYRKLVDHIATLPDKKSRNSYYNRIFPQKLNDSGCVEEIASNFHVDTTYNLAGWLVTIVYGSVKCFRTETSDKMRYVVLSILWHKSRDACVLEQHAKDIQQVINTLPADLKSRKVACFMTDQEPAIYAYSKISVLEKARHLRCLFHLRTNMCKNPKKGMGHIFGKTTGQGLEGGLLCTLHKDDYDRKYDLLMSPESEIDEDLSKYLCKNMDDLWERYSLLNRLYAGMPQQFASNNILEQYNQKCKAKRTGKKPVHESVHWFAARVKGELDEIIKAVMQTSEEVRYAGPEIWNELTIDQQDTLLGNLGLTRLLDDKFQRLPDGFVSAVGVSRLYQADQDAKSSYEIDERGNGLGFHLRHTPSNRTITVLMSKKNGKILFACPRSNCPEAPLRLCEHQLICFLQLDEATQEIFAKQYLAEDTLNDLFRSTKDPSDGKKLNQRRHLLQSKGNHKRGIMKLVEDSDSSLIFQPPGNETLSPTAFEARLTILKRKSPAEESLYAVEDDIPEPFEKRVASVPVSSSCGVTKLVISGKNQSEFSRSSSLSESLDNWHENNETNDENEDRTTCEEEEWHSIRCSSSSDDSPDEDSTFEFGNELGDSSFMESPPLRNRTTNEYDDEADSSRRSSNDQNMNTLPVVLRREQLSIEQGNESTGIYIEGSRGQSTVPTNHIGNNERSVSEASRNVTFDFMESQVANRREKRRPLANITNIANQQREEQDQRTTRSGRISVRPINYRT